MQQDGQLKKKMLWLRAAGSLYATWCKKSFLKTWNCFVKLIIWIFVKKARKEFEHWFFYILVFSRPKAKLMSNEPRLPNCCSILKLNEKKQTQIRWRQSYLLPNGSNSILYTKGHKPMMYQRDTSTSFIWNPSSLFKLRSFFKKYMSLDWNV